MADFEIQDSTTICNVFVSPDGDVVISMVPKPEVKARREAEGVKSRGEAVVLVKEAQIRDLQAIINGALTARDRKRAAGEEVL